MSISNRYKIDFKILIKINSFFQNQYFLIKCLWKLSQKEYLIKLKNSIEKITKTLNWFLITGH